MFGVFLAQKISNKPFTVVGNGSQKRDFTFVKDIVDVMVKCLKKKQSNNEIFNVGTGVPISVNEITKLLGGKKIYIPKRPGEPNTTVANIKKIKKNLNWKPKINITNGVNILLNNINMWSNAPIWDKKSISKATKDWFKHLK